MFWRVDFTPGSGQHLPGASPQHLDAAHGANCWALCKEIVPMGKAWLLLKAVSDCLQTVFWVYQSRSYTSVSRQNNSSSLQQILVEMRCC